MPFGPIIGGGGAAGGGASPFDPVFLTGTTTEIEASDSADLSIALPAGVTRCDISWCLVTVTAGAAATVKVTAHLDDARSGTPAPIYVMGNQFAGVDDGAVGPLDTTGGNSRRSPAAYTNVDDSAFLRLSVANTDFAEAGTVRVDLIVRPLPPLTGEA